MENNNIRFDDLLISILYMNMMLDKKSVKLMQERLVAVKSMVITNYSYS